MQYPDSEFISGLLTGLSLTVLYVIFDIVRAIQHRKRRSIQSQKALRDRYY